MLSKNNVQWLDLTSSLWPPLVELPWTKMVWIHYDFMVKYSKCCLNFYWKNYYWFLYYMDNDNGNVHNNQPPSGMQLESFHFISFFQVISYNFYTLVCVFICPHFLVFTFICNWFVPLFVDYATLFVILTRRKQCWPLNFLFQDDADVVAYLTMDNDKTSNARRIWHYLSNYPSNLDYPFRF
jgi:hypothetical protein